MTRSKEVDGVYEQLSTFARKARELGTGLHPGLSLVEYTQLSFIDARPGARATDIVETWGLDKSTVSRQIEQIVGRGLIVRTGERPGRRGRSLELTAAGRSALARADNSVRSALESQLAGWKDQEIALFGALLARFNDSTGERCQHSAEPRSTVSRGA